MSNPATLQTAPPFTKENASEMGRRGAIASAEARRNKIKALQPPEAQAQVMKQIARVLTWMDNEKSRDKFAELSSTLDRLWKMAYPTQGSMKGRNRAPMEVHEPTGPLRKLDTTSESAS